MEKKWVEYLKNQSSFQWTFSIPISKTSWESRILEVNNEFLIKGKKYGLLYFKEKLLNIYKHSQKNVFLKNENSIIQLLEFKSFFDKESNDYYQNLFIDVPMYIKGDYLNISEMIHRPFLNLQLLELDNFSVLTKNAINELAVGEEEIIHFTLFSSSNIWWDQVIYNEDSSGEVFRLDLPMNNRQWAYRITPRLNSFIRDLRIKTEQLGGKVLLENFDKRHVTKQGILLDSNVIYQEDIETGRVNLREIDF